MDYHLVPVADVARSLGTTPTGLDPATAQQRVDKYGKNLIVDAWKKTV